MTPRKGKIIKKYLLFEFIYPDKNSVNSVKDIDFACKDWIFFDDEENELLCQFMPPPYTNENHRLLTDLLKADAPAPADWPAYPITLKGHAATYEEALQKLRVLETEKFAYTTGVDSAGEEKSIEITRRIRSKQTKISTKTKSALVVPSLADPIPEKRSKTQEIIDSDSTTKKRALEVPSLADPIPKKRSKTQEIIDSDSTTKKRALEVPSLADPIPEKRSKTREIIDSDNSSDFEDVHFRQTSGLNTQYYPSTSRGNITALESRGQQNSISSKLSQNKNLNNIKKTTNAAPQLPKHQTLPSSIPYSYREDNNILTRIKKQNDAILSGISDIKTDVRESAENFRLLHAHLNVGGQVPSLSNFTFINDNKLDVPFKELEDFQKFDNDLETKEEFKNQFIASLPQLFDPSLKIRKTITNILRTYLSKNVALQYVAMKKTKDKLIFKKTSMITCIIAAMSTCHKDPLSGLFLNEQTFLAELKAVLPNAKDWEGGRKARAVDETDQ
ncbi:uncharacterized protein LOC122512384 [Leptopilina heterotoma]|uniref:uncharacterized protein LOC122504297 n=1 Tax=Leptopilina heterotoma TaxID=63436 RepID=UPI001CA9302E|nr:uncharacterized protein LOC122504297 [Leptopilina heterotoma]XP_043476670.1 uncharacterized protein LOC122507812 [Leptopilina heterotoma]XP_043484109.1 uncharacterized protein LOC122512384 [Leptopilina heterotoma]